MIDTLIFISLVIVLVVVFMIIVTRKVAAKTNNKAMTNKIKTTIAGIALTATIGAGGVLTGGGVTKIRVAEKDVWLTNRQYTEMRNELTGKYLLGQDFTWDEYQPTVMSIFASLQLEPLARPGSCSYFSTFFATIVKRFRHTIF